MIQSLNTKARSIMLDANLPIPFWAEMVNTAAYLQKQSPTAALEGKSPYEVLYQSLKSEETKPPVGHLQRIGYIANHCIPNEKMANERVQKFGKRSKRCMTIGYTETTKVSKLLDLEAKRMIPSTDVIFVKEENAINQKEPETVNCFPEESETRGESEAREESETRESSVTRAGSDTGEESGI